MNIKLIEEKFSQELNSPKSELDYSILYGNSPDGEICAGKDCRFIRLDQKWGIKLYCNEKMRNNAFTCQNVAHMFGLGPETGEIVNLNDVEYKYGYITEIVEQCSEEDYFDYPLKEIKIIREIGIPANDNCWFNWGVNKEGKMVLIDFGFCLD